MPELTITIHHEAGLHARPLAQFVKVAKGFDADIEVYNLTNGKGPASGISPLKLMLLSVSKDSKIKIVTDGTQGEEALQALQDLIASNFGESEG
jgi:phosphotransferase system HPr (HPr) family protein